MHIIEKIKMLALSPLKKIIIGEQIIEKFIKKCVFIKLLLKKTFASNKKMNIFETNEPRICSSLKKLVTLYGISFL